MALPMFVSGVQPNYLPNAVVVPPCLSQWR